MTAQRAKFKRVAHNAISYCLREIGKGEVSATTTGYGNCLKDQMKKGLGGRKKKSGSRRRKKR